MDKMQTKNFKKYGKNIFFVLLISFLSLMMISSVYSAPIEETSTLSTGESGVNYYISSDLSNDDIQSMLDNAVDGSTFEFVDKEYNDISLVVDKPVTIISNANSAIHTADSLTNKAQNLGIDKTFGFYFTPNSSGSILSGFNIISNSDSAITVNGADDITISNNIITGGYQGITASNTENILIEKNNISGANWNGIQLINANNASVLNNTIFNNIRSGIELNTSSDSLIESNHIHHNSFNGITLYGITSNNLITYNFIYNNLNGVYIDSRSNRDVITANTIYSNYRDPRSELGTFETGNGVLIGPSYETNGKQVEISYNYLAHNEGYQVKNNPLKDQMTIEANYYDSNDPSDSYICPMLLGKILQLEVVSVSNGIGLQIYEDGRPVDKMGTFDQKVIIDGEEYTATLIDGKTVIEVDRSVDHTVELTVGDRQFTTNVPSTTTGDDSGSDDDSQITNPGGSDESSDNQESGGETGETGGDVDNDGNSTIDNPNSGDDGSNEELTNTTVISPEELDNTNSNLTSTGNNNSQIYREEVTEEGLLEVANGQTASGSPSSSNEAQASSAGESSKAYEVTPSKISKAVTDNSGIVVIAVIVLVALFAIGYKRKNDM